MTTPGMRIHLVRAINVGGAALPMADLRAMATDLGAMTVTTYIASGNLLCVPPGDPAAFDRALETAITARFGYHREVISRTPEEMRAALDAHPFEVIEPRYSYISFLSGPPTAEALVRAGGIETGDDRWRVIGEELHLRYAHGAGRPQLKETSLVRALGVAGTARNLRTVTTLVGLAGS